MTDSQNNPSRDASSLTALVAAMEAPVKGLSEELAKSIISADLTAEAVEILAGRLQRIPDDADALRMLGDLVSRASVGPGSVGWASPRLGELEREGAALKRELSARRLRALSPDAAGAPDAPPRREVKKPVFIVGCGRSGTALLCNLLSEHPLLVQTPGYPDGEDHAGWIEHGKCVISGLGATPDIDQGHTGFHYCLHMNEWDVLPATVDAMHRHYADNVLQGDHGKFVINKNSHLSNKLRYVRQIFPDARFIHIVRDCAPMVSSWIKEMAMQRHQVFYWPDTALPCFSVLPRPQDATALRALARDDRCFPGGGVMRLVDYWLALNSHIAPQLADTPEQLMTVRYEDLIASPQAAIEGICRFLELEPPRSLRTRVRSDNNDKFREHLDSAFIDEINRLARPLRETFGYV